LTTIHRLAVLDRGEVAARVLAALADRTRDTADGSPARSVAILTEPAASAWYAREADETIDLTGALGPNGRLDPNALVAELPTADVDAVWIGLGGVADAAEQAVLTAACEAVGLAVVGPSSSVLRLLADPEAVREAAEKAGVRRDWPKKAPARLRRLDVDVVTDAVGGSWVFDPREASVHQDGWTVLVESPAPDLGAATSQALVTAARRLVEACGYVGVVTVGFEVAHARPGGSAKAGPAGDDAAAPIRLTGLRAQELCEQATTEETYDVDLTRLALAVARGVSLDGQALPQASGHAVQVRLRARDVHAEPLAAGPAEVMLLDVPPTSGVRVDAELRPGDAVSAASPTLASLSAWGHSRGQALSRLRRTLDLSSAVVRGGTSDRALLLGLLRAADFAAGAVDDGWLARNVAEGTLTAAPNAVALLVAAAEAYDADLAAAEAAFLAKAARGRPEKPEEVGGRVLLGYRGAVYSLRVDLNAPGDYRVGIPEAVAHLRVERIGEYERRVTCGGRRYRVVVSADGSVLHIEVDGELHLVTREDGVVVRTAFPAFVVSLLVGPGDRVQAGKPVAVLESMKMESTVPAPFSGDVIRLEVASNVQVEAGAPLMRLRADEARNEAQAAPVGPRVDLSGFTHGRDTRQKPCDRVYGPLRDYLLGYDLDPTTLTRLLAAQRRLAELSPPDDASLLECEDSLLDLYADLGALSRPRTEATAYDDDGGGVGEDDGESDVRTGSAQEYLIAFLRWLDADQAMLPASYRARLLQALGRYGVHSLERTPELESAVVRLYRSTWRVKELAGVITQILTRRLDETDALLGLFGSKARTVLDRLAAATQGRQQDVADLARDVRFHFLDEPVLESVVSDVYAEMEGHFLTLAANPRRPDRSHRIERLVWCPHPMRAMLLRQWHGAGDGPDGIGLRTCVLEVYTRRFYRTHTVRGLHVEEVGGRLLAAADYAEDGTEHHVVVGHVPLDELPDYSRAVAEHLAAAHLPEATEIVIDLATWHNRPRISIDEMAAETGNLLGRCEFGRRMQRVELTVTSTAGVGKDHMRTQHVSFSQNEGGEFVEEKFYRNLHSRLTRRLEMWRLSDFELERLPSAEDVYLFHGVARENPKDRRLFALAEVRDVTPVRSPDGTVTYPRLERMGMQALAAMRAALAALPARERPVANRMVLSVRPSWEIPQSQWLSLAKSFAPLAAGAGLEKVLMRVRIPEGDGVRDAVLHFEGVGGYSVTVREGAVGDKPIRPLSPYQQKVLLAARFGAPYPYEVARMLTPEHGTTSPLPPGTFQEYDLDEEHELVPVDREPGRNSAHVVCGVITNFTDVVPEGITRVAILSDPTKGLGNLAEPECRRINAAMRLAARMRVPVEWFAVSSGALIAMDSGTENMDWIADTLRRIIEHTQAGHEINIIVTGINVGGQPYWNSEATMLMHTKGILIMTPASAMVLTGKQALDFSGGVSAEDNFGIGGYDRVMGPNGQGQYWAPTFQDACALLLSHYDFAYVVPGERFPRRRPTTDPGERDVRPAPHAAVPGTDFTTVGDVFNSATNPDRKKPFDIRSVMRAVADLDCEPLERWEHWRDAENSVVWDTTVGGIPVCMLGLESRKIPRRGFVPADGPPTWTSGTLFPQASRKTARAINATSGIRPLVVLANLSGFDGSPESMRRWQLEYGAEIGRAVTNFDGPIAFVVVSRYHGGAFVVFSKALNESIEIAAVEGSYASVIGGAPAAATVFAREVKVRTEKDPRVAEVHASLAVAKGSEAAALRVELARRTQEVRAEKLGEVADEFDGIHTIERALRTGAVDEIIPAERLRPWVIEALERGMAKTIASTHD